MSDSSPNSDVKGNVMAGVKSALAAHDHVQPAWLRETEGEQRWPASLAVIVAVALQYVLPDDQIFGPRWLMTGLAVVLLLAVVAANPRRIEGRSPALRAASLTLIAVITLANAWAAAALIDALVHGSSHTSATSLLLNGADVWLTNVIAFGLWYWEFDRGGPAARAKARTPYPDFLFPQMQAPHLAPAHWEPKFIDYLYVSFTNATAFSPTDVLPVSRWAKVTMMLQSAVSLATVALVIARAVNTLQ